MIPLGGEQSFTRFWLPLIILGAVVLVLFPSFGPRRETTARERWDGLVVVITFAEAPAEPLRILATIPLRSTPVGLPIDDLDEARAASTERLVVGEAVVPAGTTAVPLLLATPRTTKFHRRANLRAIQDRSRIHGVTADFEIHRTRDFEPQLDSWFGAVIARGSGGEPEAVQFPAARARVDTALLSFSRDVELNPTAGERRWIGDPRTFTQDWERFEDEDVGSLPRFIHERWSLPPISEWHLYQTEGDGGTTER